MNLIFRVKGQEFNVQEAKKKIISLFQAYVNYLLFKYIYIYIYIMLHKVHCFLIILYIAIKYIYLVLIYLNLI